MQWLTWDGCYDEGWGDLIVKDAYAHPAKFAKGLVQRVLSFGLEQGFWRAGDRVGDPFGGIGTGGILAAYAGLEWVGVELEPKFKALAEQNFALHARKWQALGVVPPRVVQGDSRRFHELVAPAGAVVSSPPWMKNAEGKLRAEKFKDPAAFAERIIGNLAGDDLGAVLTSPPYASSLDHAPGNKNTPFKAGTATHCGQIHVEQGYGETLGNIGVAPAGALEAVISSPPYAESIHGDHGERETAAETTALRRTPGGSLGQSCRNGGYGGQAGQIGRLKEGDVAGVVTSPPYADSIGKFDGDKKSPEVLKSWYESYRAQGGGMGFDRFCQHVGSGRRTGMDEYGQSEGQIGALKDGCIDAAVTSPPFGDTQPCASQTRAKKDYHAFTRGAGTKLDHQMATDGNLAAMGATETYWQAMKQVYTSMRLAMRPGAVAAIVVKDYIKNSQRMPLCDQTCQLLGHLGFTVFLRVKAMLVKEWTENTLFDGPVKKKRERKSFFRRLHERRLPEGDERRIDWEEVIWCRAPAGALA